MSENLKRLEFIIAERGCDALTALEWCRESVTIIIAQNDMFSVRLDRPLPPGVDLFDKSIKAGFGPTLPAAVMDFLSQK